MVLVSSVSAQTGVSHQAHYAAAKAGLVNLAKSAARALAPGVRVNCVTPGLTLTPMSQETIDALDPDSDNDGLYDGTELGVTEPGDDTDLTAGHFIPDGDAGATTTDPLDADTDDGGVEDGAEDIDRDGVVDVGETDPNYGPDDVVTDTDGDGIPDDQETLIGTDPNDADSDDDGVLDGDDLLETAGEFQGVVARAGAHLQDAVAGAASDEVGDHRGFLAADGGDDGQGDIDIIKTRSAMIRVIFSHD